MTLPHLNKTCDNKKTMQNLGKLNYVAFATFTINCDTVLANISFSCLLLAFDNKKTKHYH